jgi:hypothetical protein
MSANAAYLITKVYSNLKQRGEEELAMPLELLYKRYNKAHQRDKGKIFQDFLDYCNDYDINIREEQISEKEAA